MSDGDLLDEYEPLELSPEERQLWRQITESTWAFPALVGDRKARWLVDALARSLQPAKAVHNPALNYAMRVVYEGTARGQKRAALASLLARPGRKPNKQQIDTAVRQIRRMQRRPMTDDELAAGRLFRPKG